MRRACLANVGSGATSAGGATTACHNSRMPNPANVLTLLRLCLVPVVGYGLATGAYALALDAFLLAAVSDFADGYIARRYALTSKLGATLDPIADKLNMFVATALLTWDGLLPLALGIAIVARDVVIVAGALAFRAALGHLEMAPTRLSKANTVLEFATLLLVMAAAAGWITAGPWLHWLFAVVFATVVASGVQYVALWGRKALAERRAR